MSTDHTYTNWCKTYTCRPEKYFIPGDLEELRQILAEAKLNKKKVKVVGVGHSLCGLCLTDGYMINLEKLDQILQINTSELYINVQAGALLPNVIDKLTNSNYALPILPSVRNITIGAAIATATHGSGKESQTFSAYVQELL